MTIAETHGEKLSELYLNTFFNRFRQENDDTKYSLITKRSINLLRKVAQFRANIEHFQHVIYIT